MTELRRDIMTTTCSNWPVRQYTPPSREFMHRCDECGADFMALAPGRTGTDTGWFCSRECREVDL